MKKILFVLIICFCTVIKINAQVNAGDSLALVDFYNSTNGSSWNFIPNGAVWLGTFRGKEIPIKHWAGVEISKGRVVGLSLVHHGLNGNIPASFRNLTALTSLDLSDNRLTDSVPSSIGNLTALTYLNLSENRFTDSVPSSIGNLTALTYLNLSENRFTYAVPASIGNLIALAYLNLSENKFTETLAASFGNLTALTYLDLSYNNFNGSVPSTLSNLSLLTSLNLKENKFENSLPDFFSGLSSLVSLNLMNNELSGAIPSFGKLQNLKIVKLSRNKFSKLPDSLTALKNLDSFDISSNKLSGRLSPGIGDLKNLVYFSLTNNDLSSLPSTIKKLTKLKTLDISFNNLSDALPAGFFDLKNLQICYLNNNNLHGSLPVDFGKLTQLFYLTLNNNNFNGSIPAGFTNLHSLFTLQLDHNRLSGSLPFDSTNYLAYPFTINNNNYNFDGIEDLLKKIKNASNLYYNPQASIDLHFNGTKLSVYAGGSLSNDTFHWYKNGLLVSTKTGDSVFSSEGAGLYSVIVTNAIAKKLSLYSDTISVNGLTADRNKLENNPSGLIKVYPNPAKDLVHIQCNGSAVFSLINDEGKTMLVKTINRSGVINVSGFFPGVYFLKNDLTPELKKLVVNK